MKAKIVTLTPQMAKEILKMNVGNRKLKKAGSSYVAQMKNGLWKENGEPIIIDSEGFVKDGQHRLHAVIEADYTYQVPVIYDVNPDVMDTIDTGFNRSLNDVLELNGFKYASATASAVKTIIKHNLNSKGAATKSGSDKARVTNSQGLEYALSHKEDLFNLVSKVHSIASLQPIRLFNGTELVWYVYSIAGYNFNFEHLKFIKGICTGSLGEESATYYVYNKLLQAHKNKIGLSAIYKHNLIVKAWNAFVFDDQPIKKLIIQKERLEVPIKVA